MILFISEILFCGMDLKCNFILYVFYVLSLLYHVILRRQLKIFCQYGLHGVMMIMSHMMLYVSYIYLIYDTYIRYTYIII